MKTEIRFHSLKLLYEIEFLFVCKVYFLGLIFFRINIAKEGKRYLNHMIKLIATDMDGTFLDNSKNFPQEFSDLFEELKKKDIAFVVASGNQFLHLYNQFLPHSDDIYFIAENGNYITKGKKELWCSSIEDNNIQTVMEILSRFPEVMPVICGKEKSYIFANYQCYQKTIENHYDAFEWISDLADIEDEIFKFSIHDPLFHISEYVEKIRPELPSHLKILTSGNEWMDIQSQEVHKGVGILFLQDLLQLKQSECAAFGDQMNDYEMLESVGYAYAMGNATKGIKDIAYEVILSNEEQGVIKKIKEILQED